MPHFQHAEYTRYYRVGPPRGTIPPYLCSLPVRGVLFAIWFIGCTLSLLALNLTGTLNYLHEPLTK